MSGLPVVRQPLPLYLGDVQITPLSLSGYNYGAGVPLALQALLRHSTSQLDALSLPNTVIYSGPGQQRMFIRGTKGYLPGARLMAYTLDADSKPIYVLIRVISYSATTGALYFENLFQNILCQNLAAVWALTAQYPDTLLGTPLAVASGGTGAGGALQADIQTARKNLSKGRMESFWDTFFDDFVGTPVASARTYLSPTTTQVNPTYGTSPDLTNHPGIGVITVSTLNSCAELYVGGNTVVGRSGLLPSGAATLFEADVYVPALSTGTQGYILQAGVLPDISIGSSTSGSYIKLSYTHSVNAGNWTYEHSTGTFPTTGDTGVAVVAATWYRITVLLSGGNILVQLNGSTVLSIIQTNYGNGRWSARMIKTIGGAAVNCYCDYLFLRQQVVR
jgi:hypothetical protein